MRPYPDVALDQLGVFSGYQAEQAGWTRSALMHAVRSGRLCRPRRGTYRVGDLAELADLDRYEAARWLHAGAGVAAALATPGSRVSHSTAAVLHGLPLLFLPEQACLTVQPWFSGEVPGAHLHRCTSSASDVRFGHVECHGAAHTVVDLAREHGVTSAVIAVDHALRSGQVGATDMAREIAAARGWPGVIRARRAVELADARSESPLESRSRLLMADRGLPAANLQPLIATTWGTVVARPDFYWDEYGVVGEADGAVKYPGVDPLPLTEEKRRHELMEDLGLLIVRWGSADLPTFGTVERRLRSRFAQGLRPGSPGRRWPVLQPRRLAG